MQNRQGSEIEKRGLACSQTGQILKRTNSTGWLALLDGETGMRCRLKIPEFAPTEPVPGPRLILRPEFLLFASTSARISIHLDLFAALHL